MSSFHNTDSVQNQAGFQIIQGNLVVNGHGARLKRSRFDRDDINPESELDDSILASLAFPQMSDRRRNVDPAHHQTCQWIFDMAEYISWKAAPRGLLWIKGKPGSGKSTVMSHLYSKLHEQQGESTDIKLEFFFSACGVPLQRTPLGMLRALTNQIFYQDPSIRDPLRRLFNDKCASFGHRQSSWEWQLSELKTVFRDVVVASARSRQVTIFIDALDEAGDQAARELARYFHTINELVVDQHGLARTCISCRHYPVSSAAQTTEIHVELHNRKDIETYVQDHIHLDSLSVDVTHRQQEWLGISEDVVKSARGIFQWAVLAVEMVIKWMGDGELPDEIHERLRTVPPELKGVYEHTLHHVIDRQHLKKSLRLFQWVSIAIRPLYLSEFIHMIAVSDTERRTKRVRSKKSTNSAEAAKEMQPRIRTWSGGLIETVYSYDSDGVYDRDDDPVLQVIHQSVKDFLMDGGLKLLVGLDQDTRITAHAIEPHLKDCQSIQLSHGDLYSSCLKVLSMEDPGLLSDAVRYGRCEETLYARNINYAALFCLTHAERAKNYRPQDLESESQLLGQVLPLLQASSELRYSGEEGHEHHSGVTVLQVAAAAGLGDLCDYRLRSDDDPHAEDTLGWTAIHFAAANGHMAIMDRLFDAGSDIQKSTNTNETALILAAARGHSEIFSWLMMKGGRSNSIDDTSDHVLFVAAYNSQLSICRLCIAAGSDVNARSDHRGTALQIASYKCDVEVVQLLLDAGADVNARGGRCGTALQAASDKCDVEVVQLLLDAGADVNAQGENYGTALQTASQEGGIEVVRVLLDAGADVNAQGGQYGTALLAAASHGRSEDIVQLLLDAGANVNAQGGEHGTALQAASYKGHIGVVQVLLHAGADVNIQGGQFGTALQAAAEESILSRGGGIEVVRVLLDAGADVNAQGREFGAALQVAAAPEGGGVEVVRLLLDAGADVNAQGGHYGTALQAAAASERGGMQVVRLLLDAGADVNAQGGYYGTALQAAAVVWCEEDIEVVRILLNAGANINAQGGEYGTALQAAAEVPNERGIEAVRILLDAGANINARGGKFGTALQAGSYRGNEVIVQLLLDAGADANAQGGCYGTTLQAAAVATPMSRGGDTEVVQLLLDAGADVNAQGGEYGTALYAAAARYKDGVEVVQLLLDAGADVDAQGQGYGTALSAAIARHRQDIMTVLRRAGAKTPSESLSGSDEEVLTGRNGCFGGHGSSQGDIFDEMSIDGEINSVVADETPKLCQIPTDLDVAEGRWLLQLLGRFFPR